MNLGVSFGGYYSSVANYVKNSEFCEKSGLHSIWFADSQMIHRDVYECLAICATKTRKVLLGTAVTNPVTRHPSVTACAIMTLNEISNGRAVLGIGVGDSSVRRIGLSPAKMREFEAAVSTIRRLCRGQNISFSNGENVRMRWASGGVPIFIAASGSEMLKLGARIGDGIITHTGADPKFLQDAMKNIKLGLSGREISSDLTIANLSFISISENRQEAIDNAKPYVINYWRLVPTLFQDLEASVAGVRNEFTSALQSYVRGDHIHTDDWSDSVSRSRFVPDEMVKKFVIAGTPEDCVKSLREKEQQGVKIFIARHTSDESGWERFLKLYCESVLPSFK